MAQNVNQVSIVTGQPSNSLQPPDRISMPKPLSNSIRQQHLLQDSFQEGPKTMNPTDGMASRKNKFLNQ